MAMAEIKVKQWGNSLGLIIPSDMVKSEEINEGDLVKVEILKEKIVNGFGMFKGICSFKEEQDEHGEF